jgi:ribosomal protein S18 acetylase RimI-like enzyme
VAIRGRALAADPLAFGSSPGEGSTSSVDFIRRALANPQQAIFGVFADESAGTPPSRGGSTMPLGIVGIRREPHKKSAHRATIWGLWVTREQRGRGLARALMEEALRFARTLEGVEYVSLSVGDWNASAKALYLDLGFTSWGIERDALRVGDDVVDEHHMSLRLR